MELNNTHYQQIADCFPRQRGNVSLNNLSVLNAFLYIAENGCKWRKLPSKFGNWHTIYLYCVRSTRYTRIFRWAKAGILDRVFEKLQQKQIVTIKIEVFSLDSTSVKVHPDGTGAQKKTDHNPLGSLVAEEIPKFTWLPRMTKLQ